VPLLSNCDFEWVSEINSALNQKKINNFAAANLKALVMSDRYNQRGVSASKEDVHQAIKLLDKGLFPKAFCKIVPDTLAADPDYCTIMHADGAGTKSSLAYIYWKETGRSISMERHCTRCYHYEH
jgi:hypothetical protein